MAKTSRRKGHVSEQSEVKQRILRAAAEPFMERGFAETSVREIGERADVGQSSLYHHAHSKGQLLRDLQESFVHELIGGLEQMVALGCAGIRSASRRDHVDHSNVDSHRAVVTVYRRAHYALSEEARTEVRRQRARIDAMVDLILTRGVDSGKLREDLDIPLTRLAVLGMCNWSYQWYRPDGKQAMTEITDYFAQLFVPGVLSDRHGKV